jgi:hypothetical protein
LQLCSFAALQLCSFAAPKNEAVLVVRQMINQNIEDIQDAEIRRMWEGIVSRL